MADDPLKIAFQLRDAERLLGSIEQQLADCEGKMGQASMTGDDKALRQAQEFHLALNTQLKVAQAKKLHLNAALDQAIFDELNDLVKNVDRIEGELVQEARDAAKEIGQLLARATYLEKRYCHGFLKWFHEADDIYGHRPIPPEGFIGKLYQKVIESMKIEDEKLPGSDPNAESFPARWREMQDAKSIKKDDTLRRYQVRKRRAIVLRDSQKGE
jgi:hypothetical protein